MIDIYKRYCKNKKAGHIYNSKLHEGDFFLFYAYKVSAKCRNVADSGLNFP